MIAVPERTVLAAGSTVAMRNGLTLTIPTGWTGVLKSGSSGSASVVGVLGRPTATQSLRLRRTSGTEGPLHISLSSAAQPEASGSGLARVADVGSVTVYRTGATTSAVPTLLIAQTQVPGSEYGAVLFRGEASEAAATVEEIWRLLDIEGASLGKTVACR